MKLSSIKNIVYVTIITGCFAVFISCSKKSQAVIDATCHVAFILNQTNAAGDTAFVQVKAGQLAQNVPALSRPGFTFAGWYTDAADANPDPTKNTKPPKFPAYDVATKPIYLDVILYARWTK